jgi:protein-L-isoaspartate(D-aspartate) O-methyltransferase
MDARTHLIRKWKERGIATPEMIDSFLKIERKNFIPKPHHSEVYDDNPLPIGHGQTISQPTTIMMMIHWLGPRPEDNILEVGAGSGYNAAILSGLCDLVTTIEFIPSLAEFARKNLQKEGIGNVDVIRGDGSIGCPSAAPFDKIIVTAACPEIPPPLIAQLKEGGTIIAPVGETRYSQTMVLGRKTLEGLQTKNLGDFVFVPLRGMYGSKV